VPWNGPYHERLGLETVSTDQSRPAIAAHHDLYRQYPPLPNRRVFMRMNFQPKRTAAQHAAME
jgi:hypothetical protein